MQKWEYIMHQGSLLTDLALKDYGDRGWELVSVLKIDKDEFLYIFKKPKK